jgi:hypothetical protein
MSVYAPASLLTEAAQRPLKLSDPEIVIFADSIKFAQCVPLGLLARTIVAR